MNPLSQNLIVEWGLQKLPLEEQTDMIERLGRIIYQALLVRSLDILSDVEQEELDLLLDEDTTEVPDVLVFLESKIPTFQIVLQEEVEKLKADVLVTE